MKDAALIAITIAKTQPLPGTNPKSLAVTGLKTTNSDAKPINAKLNAIIRLNAAPGFLGPSLVFTKLVFTLFPHWVIV